MEFSLIVGIYLGVGLLAIGPVFWFDRWNERQLNPEREPSFPPHWRLLIFVTVIGWPVMTALAVGTVIQLVRVRRRDRLSIAERAVRRVAGYKKDV